VKVGVVGVIVDEWVGVGGTATGVVIEVLARTGCALSETNNPTVPARPRSRIMGVIAAFSVRKLPVLILAIPIPTID